MVLQAHWKLKKHILFFIFLSSIISFSYAQKRVLKPILNYTGDAVTNFSGGDKRSLQYMGLIDAGLIINTDSACWWKGGILNIELISTHGKGISATVLHDLQGISGIEAGNHPLLIWELWYHQQFGKLGLRGGFQNINSDFMNQPFTDDFSGGSYATFPTLALNYSLPNYPTAGLGISFSYQFNTNWYALTSVFNGRVSSINDKNRYDTDWRLNPQKDGILSVTEVKYTSEPAKYPAYMMGVGFVFHNKKFVSIKDANKNYKDNYTFYAFGEYDFYRDTYKTTGLFLQGSYAVKNRNPAYGYSAIGLVMSGFFSRSHDDIAGIGLSQLYYQEINGNKIKNRTESTVETFIKYQINKYLTVKPTFYVIVYAPKPVTMAAMIEFGITVF